MSLLSASLRCLLVFALFSASSWSYAVNESRIWLPKKFSEVKPKLLAAARQAEAGERCLTVVSGEMIVGKNTQDSYYFLITCRDKNFKTYSLSYLFPIAGEAPKLVAEQRSKEEEAKQKTVEIEESGVNVEQALQLCRNDLQSVTDALDGVLLLVQEISAPSEKNQSFFYQLPFTAKSNLGNDVRYHTDCQVSVEGKAHSEIVLHSSGALTLCQDELRAEAVLLGRLMIDESQISESAAAKSGDFRFQIPFDVKSRIGSFIRYASDCQVNDQGDAEVELFLAASGALAICKDSMLAETLLMRSVEVAEQPSWEQAQAGRFNFHIPFTANDPDGNKRNFKAICEVDEEGGADVTTEIDSDAILSVCIKDLKIKTKTMKGVVILEDQFPELEQHEDGGYLGIIPFNAKDPSGRTLFYQAACRVDGSGRSKIKITGRKP